MAAERATDSGGVVDFHNHVVPGVDDGASDAEQSREALRAMCESGVRVLVATPHLDGSLTLRPEALAGRLAELDAGWERLRAVAAEAAPELRLERGVELMLDTPEPDLSDARLRLAGGPFVLMEFPFMTVPPQAARAVAELRVRGWMPIIAHPERYGGLDPALEACGQWRRHGGHLQLNAGSLLGRYGDGARKTALELLARGWGDYIASDYHARGRVMIRAVRTFLEELGGAEQARLLLEVNPARILEGEAPIPVPPLRARRGLWARIAEAFRATARLGALAVAAAGGFAACEVLPVDLRAPTAFESVSVGYAHTCAVANGGEAYCWGRGFTGELGIGPVPTEPAPVRVHGGIAFAQVSAGRHHTCGVSRTGEAYCWGWNAFGQLGIDSTVGYGEPAPVAGELRFRSISSGMYHTCGITEDFAAYCWGLNQHGQLGDGGRDSSAFPVPVAGGVGFAQISAGGVHTCALTVDGEAYCWGQNHVGQLGDGTLELSDRPVPVAGGHRFVGISAGMEHTCAVTAGELAYCWGSNNFGELGQGGIEFEGLPGSATPVQVKGGATYVRIDAGDRYTCGVDPGGGAHCWGWGEFGQTGVGTTINWTMPQWVDGGFVSVSAGLGRHTCGVRTDAAVYCWGSGREGQLGNPSTSFATRPVRVDARR